MFRVVGKSALLQDVSSLGEHLLQVDEELVQLLGCSSNKITEARYCSKFSTDFLDLHLAFKYYFLQRDMSMRYCTQAENITKVSKKNYRSQKFFGMSFQSFPFKFPDVVIKGSRHVAILSLQSIDSCHLHADNEEVKRHDLEQVLFVFAEQHQSKGLSVYEESEVALIGIQGASEGLVSGFQFKLNKYKYQKISRLT